MSSNPPDPPSNQALRLTFEYDGKGKLTLKSIRRLAMRVPPGHHSPEASIDRVGRYVELRGDKGNPIYRRQITEVIPETLEYPTGDPARPFGRVPNRTRGVLSVLVPAIEGARSVSVVENEGPGPDRAATRGQRLRDLITVDLSRDEETH